MSIESAEAAVLANPDDDRAWQVYSDALQAVGDPRGELIALQARLARGDDPAALERERALIAAHLATWLWPEAGPLLEKTRLASGQGVPLDLTWRYGFPSQVVIQGVSYRSEVPFPGLGETWLRLASRPENVRFVRAVTFGSAPVGDEANWDDAAQAIAARPPPLLRALTFDRGHYWDISSTSLFGLDGGFWKALPRLEELSIEMGQIGLSDIDAPALRSFSVVSSSFDDACVEAVTQAKWPLLERLSLSFGDPNYGGLEDSASVAALLAGPRPAHHLGLCNAMFSDEFPAMLLSSSWLPGLTSLDLSDGTLGDAGAQVLLDNRERFRGLTALNLGHGYFSDEMVERLKASFPFVELDDLQGEAEPDDRYVSVSE
ncbi:MAG: TIGR02996 domain-containing protein [Myxococcota bacterium]